MRPRIGYTNILYGHDTRIQRTTSIGILITDTTLRDAHQSLIATRMRTRDMLPIVEKMDEVGFHSLEVWGGATFDSCIRFLNEDPWERLRAIREKARNTRLQMLLRGQNLVGYRHYADDVLREFIRLSVKNGIDIFRIFDALNDTRNMEMAIRVVREYGAHAQGTICFTISPVHTVEKFTRMAVELEQLGCESICVKDMSGIISPAVTRDLVKAIKEKVKLPLALHSHCSSGMAPISYYEAVLAGADILDTAFSAFSGGTSQPPTETMVAAFRNTPYDAGLDLELLYEIGEYFSSAARKYAPLFTAETIRPNISVLLHQVPGGMLSNLVIQLREQNALDKLGKVLEEVPRVREEFGYPPLVTPTSQMVGVQAVLNVLNGGRYKKVTEETKNYLLGYYGRPPGEVNKEIMEAIVGDAKPIDVRPAELIAPELGKLQDEAKKMGILHKEEDLITYALYPAVAAKFLRGELKEEALAPKSEVKEPTSSALELPTEFGVDVDGEIFSVKIFPVLGKAVAVPEKPSKPKKAPVGAVVSPLHGMVAGVKVKVGAKVKEGDTVAVVESMKMQNEIDSPNSGTVTEIYTHDGEAVSAGDILMVIQPDER